MGTPDITEQVRDVPVRALRAVFAGVGRLLLVADRIRGESGQPRPRHHAADDQPDPLSARTGPGASARASSGAGAADRGKWRSLDETGNVRILGADDVQDIQKTEFPGENGPSAPAPPAEVPTAGAAMPMAAPAGPPGLPGLPGYDGLSLASLRARLRGLDLASLRAALAYEQGHAGRPDVIAMFERRIEKLSGAA